MSLHAPINDGKSGMRISQTSAIAVIINMKFITDSARLSLLRRLKETATKEEYDDLKNSFKFYNQLKKRPKLHKKELNNFFLKNTKIMKIKKLCKNFMTIFFVNLNLVSEK